MNKLPNHTALKEWASVIDALGRGEQVILIRKGGIADPHFGLEADRFYLFPTNFHESSDVSYQAAGAAERRRTVEESPPSEGDSSPSSRLGMTLPSAIQITHWAEAVRTWQVRDLDTLHRLEPLVVMDRVTLDTRYRFRPDQAINVIAVRTFRLAQPVAIAMRDEYEGCRSWISIEEEISIDGSTSVLSDAALTARIESIDALLAAVV